MPLPTLSDILDEVENFGGSLVSDLDDAVKDIGSMVGDAIGDATSNLIDIVTGIPSDVYDFIQELPGAILDAVVYMLHDPQFWMGVLAFMGLVVAAQGLAAAQAAAEGAKWKAFLDTAGIYYHGTGLSFINKAHRITYLLSPGYRRGFEEKFMPAIQQLSDAGVDIGTAAMLIGDVMSLSRSIGTMFGADWEASKESWDIKMSEWGTAIAQNADSWAKDPDALFRWLDEHLIAPEQNAAAGWFNRMNSGLEWITDKGEKLFANLDNISKQMTKVSKDLSTLGYEDLAKKFEAGAAGVGELFAAEWDYLRKTFTSVGEILKTKTRKAVALAGAGSGGKTFLRSGIGALKKRLELPEEREI